MLSFLGRRAKAKDRSIGADQTQAKRELQRKVKLLILGAGDSGKTTLRKQLAYIHSPQLSAESERVEVAPAIINNLVQGFQAVLKASLALAMPIPQHAREQALLLSLPENAALTHEIQHAMRLVIALEAFQLVYARRSSYQLQDCWYSFASSCVAPGSQTWGFGAWVPTVDECIRARVRTCGVVEQDITYQGTVFRLYDCGGQRAERRKWMHQFAHVSAVVFVAASSEYDQCLFEDNHTNRLQESVKLFEETCNSKWFSNSPVVLFLNKRDLFEEKFAQRRIPINASGLFPSAPSDCSDVQAGLDWVASQFTSVVHTPNQQVFVHHITATDSPTVKRVFADCANTILLRHLSFKAGLVN